MANKKTGFLWYSLSTSRYYSEAELRKLKNMPGMGGEAIAIHDYLLAQIYTDKGCYLQVDYEIISGAAEYWRVSEDRILEIIDACCETGLFHARLYAKKKMLSSSHICYNWVEWGKKLKRSVTDIPGFLQHITEEPAHSPEESGHSPEESDDTGSDLPRKERKGNEKKGSSAANKNLQPPSSDDNVEEKQTGKPAKKTTTKKEKVPEPFWQKLVECWFDFHKAKNWPEPSFIGKKTKDFKDLLQLLKNRKEKGEWNEASCVSRLNAFLEEAFKVEWLKDHFTAANLVTQFDTVIQKAAASRSGKNSTSAVVIQVDVRSRKETNYLYDTYCDGTIGLRHIDGYQHSFLEKQGLLNFDEEQGKQIAADTEKYFIDNPGTEKTPDNWTKFYRKHSVMFLFKTYKEHNKTAIFE